MSDKELVMQFYELVVNGREFDLIHEMVAEDAIEHEEFPGLEGTTVERIEQFFQMMTSAFPDYRMDVEDMIQEGDKVVARVTMTGTHKGEFMGMPATGKRFSIQAIDILRLKNGQMIEHWGVTDTMAMMEQLGAFQQ